LNGDSKVLKDGTTLYEDREGSVPYGHYFYKDDFEDGIKQLDSLYITTKDIDYLSDKGLLLILLERYEEAIKLYLEIEKIKPNRYSTASNIGTAYELIGQNENALKWIKKSLELDPKSHNNSEWIHVKILEAKIKGEQFYTATFLLNTEFGSDTLPRSHMTKQQLQDLSDALYYQLNERISFVKPKEKIVAQLLFDIGNIAFLLGNYYDASADYEQAKLYGYAGQLIKQRIEQTKIRIKQAEQQREQKKVNAQKQSSYLTYELFIGGGLLLTILTIIIYRRKKKNNS
jgi:tetratricopeptide (TPR) repeat protein